MEGTARWGTPTSAIYNELEGLTTLLKYDAIPVGCCGIVLLVLAFLADSAAARYNASGSSAATSLLAPSSKSKADRAPFCGEWNRRSPARSTDGMRSFFEAGDLLCLRGCEGEFSSSCDRRAARLAGVPGISAHRPTGPAMWINRDAEL